MIVAYSLTCFWHPALQQTNTASVTRRYFCPVPHGVQYVNVSYARNGADAKSSRKILPGDKPIDSIVWQPSHQKCKSLDKIPDVLYSISVHIGGIMTIQTTYTQARDGLAKLLDQVTHNREIVVIQRRGEEEVAMIAASELKSLMETAYLLRSPANAERLLTALGRALKGEGEPQSIERLRSEINLEP